ncbi:hypothetical protein LEP1GSC052_3618 [Leptospira kmetyi serovar Malaysia str. Bejo-Iso9]|nr:hypothetical protein LEP1GSC052_3618 [Leptospira kmetyi serovar Malaysia str. Bejo-Iso9]
MLKIWTVSIAILFLSERILFTSYREFLAFYLHSLTKTGE